MLKKILTILMLLCLCNHLSAQVANYCLRLSPGGSVDCGPMPELDGQKAFTVQFWMYADTWAEDATLMSRGDDFSVRLGAEGKMNITLGGTTYLVNSTDLAPGRWNQVTILSTGTRIRTYVNKKQLKSSSLEEGFSEAGGNFILGGDRFRGRLDEVRVWNAELSSDYD
ncbi:MAG: LamG domain-containing protein, partial [Alloprevotella sp.]|nr:LamG domain-containing protein [Alloprevotella sp.]